MDPSAGHKNCSPSVSVLLNIAGVEANLQKEMISINKAVKNQTKKTTKFPLMMVSMENIVYNSKEIEGTISFLKHFLSFPFLLGIFFEPFWNIAIRLKLYTEPFVGLDHWMKHQVEKPNYAS